jgi:hypothetical protein
MKAKNKPLKNIDQVKEILHSQGLSKVFNEQDYNYFLKHCKRAHNVAQAIVEKFIQYYSDTPSDFNDYVF